MKILIVTQYFWPESFRINNLAEGLAELGVDVSILTGLPNYPQGKLYEGYSYASSGREEYKGMRIVRVPIVTRGRGSGLRLAINYLSFALLASIMGPFRCKDKYDLIFVYEPSPITVMIPAIVLKKIRKVPIILWVQDLWPESLSATGAVKSNTVLALIGRMVRYFYQQSDKILIQSQAFKKSIIEIGGAEEKIIYYPNYAEAFYSKITSELLHDDTQILPEGFRVVFAGNIGAAQDFETILSAAEYTKHKPEIKWIVIGDGRERKRVEQEVKRRGLQECVYLIGKHPAEKMPTFFSLADALLVTLKREPIFALTIPSKVQSYLAAAKPIVAALEGEGSRIIEESRAGLTSPPGDPEALARSITKLYEMNEKDRKEMGECGRAYFLEHFERTDLVKKLHKLMETECQGSRTCAY